MLMEFGFDVLYVVGCAVKVEATVLRWVVELVLGAESSEVRCDEMSLEIVLSKEIGL